MGILPDAQTGTCAVVDVQTSFVPGVVRMSETKMLETMAKESTVGSARKIAFRVIGPKELTELVDVKKEWIPPAFAKSKFIVLATIDGEYAGVCGIRGVLNTVSTEVSEKSRGQGLGKELLKRVIFIARQRGEKLILSNAISTNHPSLKMTARLGFLDIFRFSWRLGDEMMTILPLSTTGWFVVISLRLLRRIDSRVLGHLFTMVQRLMSKT